MTRHSCLDDAERCPDCDGLITSELLGEPRHDEGFGEDRCDCDEARLSCAAEGVLAHARDTRGGYLDYDNESEVA